MSVSGGIKFFYKNRGDIEDSNTFPTVSSGSTTATNAQSRKPYLWWESVGSDDVTTETYQLNFGASKDIDRLILKRHNFKNFFVKYWNGAAWTHFANVVTKEGTQANITETGNTKTTSYYEFTEVSTDKILISIDTTQAVDAEKYIYEIIATKELGTFQGYPVYQGGFAKKLASKVALSGQTAQTILGERYHSNLSFTTYPTEVDHNLMVTLWDLNKEFLIYPCGANEDQYRFSDMKGNRLRDIFLVNFVGNFEPNYNRNVYINPLNYKANFLEVP